MKLQDRVAIITGAERGIGRAIAELFVKEGAYVVIASLNKEVSEQTAQEIGDRAFAVQTNVSDAASVHAMASQVVAKYKRIDVLVNNAGIHGPLGVFDVVDENAWWQAVQVNLGGTFFCSKAVLPTMIAQGSGAIINFGGGGATSLRRNFSAYAASKTAVIRLTENMGAELQQHHIRVNCIAPGAIATQLQDEIIKMGEAVVGPDAMHEAQEIKAGRMGVPITVPAELALWLASDDSAPLTGKVISAIHDGWRTWTPDELATFTQSETFTLRRVKN